MQTNYEKAVAKVRFISNFYKKFISVFIFNASYSIYLFITKGIWYNDISIFFILLSICFIAYHCLKFGIKKLMVNWFSKLVFTKKHNLFITHLSIFISLFLLKVLVDVNRTILTDKQIGEYQDYGYWLIIIIVHFIIVFYSYFSFFKNWEEQKIQEIMKKNKL